MHGSCFDANNHISYRLLDDTLVFRVFKFYLRQGGHDFVSVGWFTPVSRITRQVVGEFSLNVLDEMKEQERVD